MSDREEAKIAVPREDPTDEESRKQQEQPDSLKKDNTQGSVPGAEEFADLTEEDRLLKEKLNDLVKQLGEEVEGNSDSAFETLGKIRGEIQTSTSSMTSVPKPLKFLRPHVDFFKAKFDALTNEKLKVWQT
jgi:26S proteasome regulatory subunit N1